MVDPPIFENNGVERFDTVFQTFDDIVERAFQIESRDDESLQALPHPA